MKIAIRGSSAMHSHWQKQGTEPLFPGLLWSRPETKTTAGKLLIIGGTGQEFAGVAEAYTASAKAGAGSVRALLPISLQKTISKLFPEVEYGPATPSGSFAVSALAEFLAAAAWSEGVLIAGDTGNNSETTRLFEAFLHKYSGQLSLCGDSIDMLLNNPSQLLEREATTLVLSFTQLQKLAVASHFDQAFTSDMGLLRLVEVLHDFNKLHQGHLVVQYDHTVAVAVDGRVSTTERSDNPSANTLAAHAAVWWLQNPSDPYAALTTSIFI